VYFVQPETKKMMFPKQITIRQKKVFAVILAVLILFGAGILLVQKFAALPALPTVLSQEDLAILVKPSIVRIIQHTTGEVTLPALVMDLDNLAITVDPGKKPRPQKLDEYLSGSGFVVNPDGYILTNAHVVSAETIKETYAEDLVQTLLEEKTKGLSDKEISALGYSAQSLADFLQRSLDVVKKNSRFDLKTEVTVLSPNSSQESLEGLLKNGFSAEVISLDQNFFESEKDVALIKIKAQNLPAINLGDGTVTTGNRIFVFGFPSTAELNQKNPLEATFTSGLISAIKYSQNKDFKIFQTDAKISEGSSGGPLLNSQGQAVGIITMETGLDLRAAGDNFAFALPTALGKSILQDSGIANVPGSYLTHFASGLNFYAAKQCKLASQEFTLARQTNQQFVADKYINPYIQACEELTAKGQSLDNAWQQMYSQIKILSDFTWFVVGGRIILILLAVWIFWKVFQRIQKDEQEMDQLSADLEKEKTEQEQMLKLLAKKGVDLPLPDTELHADTRAELSIPHPHIVDFVHEARTIGMQDGQITEELLKAGWSRDEILRAINSVV
jgi:serine protease Do